MRHSFHKRDVVLPLPDLKGVQTKSFEWLLEEGIPEILEELGRVEDASGRGWTLTLTNPQILQPNRTIEEALHTGQTYDVPWYLTSTIEDPISKKSKEQSIYMGDIPLMTVDGTFIINGAERVVINQLIRSEGVLFTQIVSPVTGQQLAGAKVLPRTGVWLEIETSRSGVITVKIDRKRKMPITAFLRIFGLETDDEIRAAFADVEKNPEINYIENTLAKDSTSSYDEACMEVFKKQRPGEPLVLENARALVDLLFFNIKRYSLGPVGRFRLNQVLGLNFPNDPKHRLLQLEDLIKIVSRVIELNNGIGEASDVDHLSCRRVKSVGELLQSQIRIGFLRMERNIKERMTLSPRDELPQPSSLISPRAVAAQIHSFFATGQLSQFHDQQNPHTALDNVRRLTVQGPGGLTKERASIAVRDVHYSYFGRICTVRTPEGQSIGLINYLAMYARVNEYGFLETPYIKLAHDEKGVKLTDEIVYLTAYEEDQHFITDQSVNIDENNYITEKQVPLRKATSFILGDVANADYIEVVPSQVLGISAGLIPFVQNDDVARALMGTQQISQAVPLIRSVAPIVGTGIEAAIARNTNALTLAEDDGTVEYADAETVKVTYKNGNKTIYKVAKFKKSNAKTCINQRVTVVSGQTLKKGDILFEGPAVSGGELSLGTNIKAAYMIYDGLEFEDGIVISDRLVKEDILTSIHIDDYSVSLQETKLGREELTRDIPNVPEETLRNLDEDGIVAVGSKVKSGDILVGKVAPKGDQDLTAEERLLRAIFGEKAQDIRDTSLKLPHGEHGVVIGVKRVTQQESEALPTGTLEEITVYVAQQKKIEIGDKLAGRHGNKGVISAIVPSIDMPVLPDGSHVDIVFSSEAALRRMNVGQLLEASLGLSGSKLNKQYTVPTLQEIPEELIQNELKEAGLPTSGKMKLKDGRTGDYFSDEIVVGDVYILKLIHLSEEKMHARSTGPYSLITQQPLGGKAQFGGQRFGEMEVWALEAYGAKHILQEMLTIKSDDMIGRTQAYSAMIQGKVIPQSTVPETFKLLVRQLNGLGLGLDVITEDGVNEITEDAQELLEEVIEPAEEKLMESISKTDKDILDDVNDFFYATSEESK